MLHLTINGKPCQAQKKAGVSKPCKASVREVPKRRFERGDRTLRALSGLIFKEKRQHFSSAAVAINRIHNRLKVAESTVGKIRRGLNAFKPFA